MDGRTLRSHLSTLPEGHTDRAPLEAVKALPEYLSEYVDKFKQVAAHRDQYEQVPAMKPLLQTLRTYDAQMRIEREPSETEILLTLDLIERSEMAKLNKPPDNPKGKPKRGNRR